MKDLRLFTGATEIGWLRVDSISGEGNLTIMETYKLDDRLKDFDPQDGNFTLKVQLASNFAKLPKTFGDIIEFATENSLVLLMQDSKSSELIVGGVVIDEATPLSPAATDGVAYTNTISTTGSSGSLVWSVSSGTPTGLSIDSSTGVLSGTPVGAGTYVFTISAFDTVYQSTTSKEFTLVVA